MDFKRKSHDKSTKLILEGMRYIDDLTMMFTVVKT